MFLLGHTLNPFKHVQYALLVFEGMPPVPYLLTCYLGVGMSTAQKIMDQASIHRMCKVGELTEAMTERIRLQLQPIIDGEKQKRLVKMQKARTAIKPILPH